VTRTAAMQGAHNAAGSSIPAHLADRIEVLKQVQDRGLTPAQAEAVLNQMGTSTRQLAHEMSSYVESLQTLRPPPPPKFPFGAASDMGAQPPMPRIVAKGLKPNDDDEQADL
jgi:hypothetical protein